MMSQQYNDEYEKFLITRRPTTQTKTERKKRILQESGFSTQKIVDQLNFIEKFSKVNMQSRVK